MLLQNLALVAETVLVPLRERTLRPRLEGVRWSRFPPKQKSPLLANDAIRWQRESYVEQKPVNVIGVLPPSPKNKQKRTKV
jgi:hypothetical protein